MDTIITWEERVLDSSRLIFISFEQGCGGHRLGRVISCLPDVHWYSHRDNGINPWNVHYKHTDIKQRHVSRYHYDRLVPKGSLPPLHDYVKDFIPDEEHYYNRFFYPRFEKMSGPEIMKKNRLVICTHELPEKIIKRFPKAKVLNLIGDSYDVGERYLQTTALFPGFLKMKWLGGENTEYGKKLRTIAKELGSDFTIRDIWAWDKYKTKYIEEKHCIIYSMDVHYMIRERMWDRKHINSNNVHDVYTSRSTYKWLRVKEFLNDTKPRQRRIR